jgi:hypothetical protein
MKAGRITKHGTVRYGLIMIIAYYLSATIFMKAYQGVKPYRDWVRIAGLENSQTKDGCKWLSSKLSYAELNQMMEGLNS